jgi:hypothetical protein
VLLLCAVAAAAFTKPLAIKGGDPPTLLFIFAISRFSNLTCLLQSRLGWPRLSSNDELFLHGKSWFASAC